MSFIGSERLIARTEAAGETAYANASLTLQIVDSSGQTAGAFFPPTALNNSVSANSVQNATFDSGAIPYSFSFIARPGAYRFVLSSSELSDVSANGVVAQIPEPATMALMGFGLIAFGLARYRKKVSS